MLTKVEDHSSDGITSYDCHDGGLGQFLSIHPDFDKRIKENGTDVYVGRYSAVLTTRSANIQYTTMNRGALECLISYMNGVSDELLSDGFESYRKLEYDGFSLHPGHDYPKIKEPISLGKRSSIYLTQDERIAIRWIPDDYLLLEISKTALEELLARLK